MLDNTVNKVKKLFSIYGSLIRIADAIIIDGDDSMRESYKAWRHTLDKARESIKSDKAGT